MEPAEASRPASHSGRASTPGRVAQPTGDRQPGAVASPPPSPGPPAFVGRPRAPPPPPMTREEHFAIFAGAGFRKGPDLLWAPPQDKGGTRLVMFAMRGSGHDKARDQAAPLGELHDALARRFGAGDPGGAERPFSIFVCRGGRTRTSIEGRDTALVLRLGADFEDWTPDQTFHRLARGVVRPWVKVDGQEGDERGPNVRWFNEGEIRHAATRLIALRNRG